MAVYKDIPRFDGSGITEYYRINTGEIVKLSSDYDSLEDKPSINGIVLEGDLTTADLNIPLGDLAQLKTEIKDNIVNAINELHLEATDFEQSITNKVNSIISFTIVWVEKLPEAKDAHHNTVYLVPKTSMAEEGNYCEEYLYTDHGWEKIGDTKVDLSGYYTKTEVDTITDELTEQVDTILEDYATKEELEDRADALEEQVDTILEDYATEDYVKSLSIFESITPPPAGEIYCINDGEMKANTFYELPRGVLLGYRDANGNAIQFEGTANTTYLNTYRAVAFNNVNLNYQYSTYGALIAPTSGNPSWVYNPGLGITKTGATNFASCGRFGTINNGYLTTSNVTTSLPTSYSSFDTQVLSGNVGYGIGQRLNALETFRSDTESLHTKLNSPAYYKLSYDNTKLVPDPNTYQTFSGVADLGDYFVASDDGMTYVGTTTKTYQTISMSITVDKDYDFVPLTVEAYKYSSSYYPSILLNGEVYYGSGGGGNGNMTYNLTFTNLKAGDVITFRYGSRYANYTYTATFGQAYSKMIQPYEDQVKEQLTEYLPLLSDEDGKIHSVLLYEKYDNDMKFIETIPFSNWQPNLYITPINEAITNISTNYTFNLNADGYYQSNCQGVSSGYALCKIDFNLPVDGDVVIEYISQGENNYDYGLFSRIDTSFSNNNSTESTSTIFFSCQKTNDGVVHTFTYPNVVAGEHFIYVKYRKDSGGDTGLDSLQFKLLPLTSKVTLESSQYISSEVYSSTQDSSSNYKLTFLQNINTNQVEDFKIKYIDRTVKSYVITADNSTNTNFNLSPHIEKFRAWYEDYRNNIYSNIIIKSSMYKVHGASSASRDAVFVLDKIEGWTSIHQPHQLFFRTTAPSPQATGMVGAVDIISFSLSYDTDGSLKTVHGDNSHPLQSAYRDAHLQPLNYNSQFYDWQSRRVLTVTNTMAWEPTGDYNPATKKYVDDYRNTIALINHKANSITKYWNNGREFSDTKPTDELQLAARGSQTTPRLTYTLEQPMTIKAGTTIHFHAPYKNSNNSSYVDDVNVWFDIVHDGETIYTSDEKIFYTKYGSPSPMYYNDLYYSDFTVDDIQLLPGDQIRFYWYGYFVYYDNQFIFSTPAEPTYMVIYNLGVSASNVYVPSGQSITEYIDTEINNIKSFGVEIVDTLPTENISTSTVYMVPSDKTEEQNVRDEYLYTENGWEMIGSTKVDLSDYYNKSEVDTLVANAEGNIQAAKDYTDERIDALYLHCSAVEYNALTQQERDSFLVAIVDDMAESGEDVETLLQEILMDKNPTETEDDLTEDEAMAILDEIIEGGV